MLPFEKYDDLVNSGTVDAVLIAVPHYLHPPYAIKALNKDLHVLLKTCWCLYQAS